jgi:hypothetical protein
VVGLGTLVDGAVLHERRGPERLRGLEHAVLRKQGGDVALDIGHLR